MVVTIMVLLVLTLYLVQLPLMVVDVGNTLVLEPIRMVGQAVVVAMEQQGERQQLGKVIMVVMLQQEVHIQRAVVAVLVLSVETHLD